MNISPFVFVNIFVTDMVANVHDVTPASQLIREDDEIAYGDMGYIGVEKWEEVKNNKHLSIIGYAASTAAPADFCISATT